MSCRWHGLEKMISSLFNLIVKLFVLILKAFGLLYHLASATNFTGLLILGVIVFVLSRWFRLKQPTLPEHLAHTIHGGGDGGRQCFSNTNSNAMECCWTPIANRAACLDNVENSKSAIEKVS